jgi:hypothetical protein
VPKSLCLGTDALCGLAGGVLEFSHKEPRELDRRWVVDFA